MAPLELEALGTVDLFDAPPLKVEEVEPLDSFGVVEVLGDVFPLAPPLKVDVDDDELGLVLDDEPGLFENEPDRLDVLGALPVLAAKALETSAVKNKHSTAAIILVLIFANPLLP